MFVDSQGVRSQKFELSKLKRFEISLLKEAKSKLFRVNLVPLSELVCMRGHASYEFRPNESALGVDRAVIRGVCKVSCVTLAS